MEPSTPITSEPTEGPDAAAASAGPDLTGQTLGEFHVLRRLGQGGMGQVYLAEQVNLKRKVALKILRPDVAANATSLQRFKAEAEAVAKATHANIVQVYTYGDAQGQHYMALEYVEGRNLREYVARKGPPEVLLALSIMRQVAAALQRASELGIIHRDIKPENILLTRTGEVKVADFGLSRVLNPEQQPLNLTQSGVTMGTPLYMSPEQVEGLTVDPRSDIYSFGVTCYHMLAGEPPFRGKSAFEVALQHVKSEPRPLAAIRPDLPAELCAVVHKMMAKSPTDRYQSGRDLLKDLVILRDKVAGATGQQTQAVSLSGLAISAPLVGLGSETSAHPGPKAGRRKVWPLFAASVVLALAGGAAVRWYTTPEQPTPSHAPDPTVKEVEALYSLEKRERFLNDAVEEYANPAGDLNKLDLGVKHCIELVMFYLDDQLPQLDKAEALCKRLIDNPYKEKVYTPGPSLLGRGPGVSQ
jgi:serine/threonine-protein kinase